MKTESRIKHDFVTTLFRNSTVKAVLILLVIFSLSTVPVAASSSTITISTATSSVFMGDSFTVSGVNTDSDYVTLYMQGVNFELTPIVSQPVSVSADDTWTATIDSYGITSANGRKLIVGTYNITAVASNASIPEDPYEFIRATVALPFKQPFISITSAPEVIVQGTSADFVVKAEAARNGIQWYVFGTSYFNYGAVSTADDINTPNQFTVKFTEKNTDIAPGQYFAVFQHPMYDGLFNIGPKGSDIVLSTSGSYTSSDSMVLFNAWYLGTHKFAAQALCDELDSQNIDDIYVKYSFFVVPEEDIVEEDVSFIISEIPEEVVKGDKIVISGVYTANAGELVNVEMISTAFAAVPKETVDSASFIADCTNVAKDGTWEVKLDTSELNIDEYAVSVEVNSVVKKVVTVNIIEEKDEPINPDQPQTQDPTPTPDDLIPQPEILKKIKLLSGWNFVSVQKTLDASNNTAAKVFGHVDTAGNAVLGYNAAVQSWEQITADTVIKPLSAYWIYANKSATVNLYYSDVPAAPAVKNLYEGWNAVGLSAGIATTANSAFAGLDWRTVLPWNLEKGTWGTPLVNGGSSVNSAEQYLTLGNGCWLYVEADGTLIGLIA